MKIDDVFPSRTLKAADLGGRKIKLTIANVEMEKMGDDMKPVMYFKGKEKGLVLNKTKAAVLTAAFGGETDNWYGKEIAIYPAKVAYNGQMVDSINVEPVLEMADAENDPPF